MNNKKTVQMNGEFIVFLIGMRINNWWKIRSIFQVISAMSRMITELSSKPASGLLSHEQWFGRTTIMVQYWESFEKLEAFANQRDASHFPAWMNYYKQVKKSGPAVGIWHETYTIHPGNYEAVYGNMPLFGLAKAGKTQSIHSDLQTAKQRMRASMNEK